MSERRLARRKQHSPPNYPQFSSPRVRGERYSPSSPSFYTNEPSSSRSYSVDPPPQRMQSPRPTPPRKHSPLFDVGAKPRRVAYPDQDPISYCSIPCYRSHSDPTLYRPIYRCTDLPEPARPASPFTKASRSKTLEAEEGNLNSMREKWGAAVYIHQKPGIYPSALKPKHVNQPTPSSADLHENENVDQLDALQEEMIRLAIDRSEPLQQKTSHQSTLAYSQGHVPSAVTFSSPTAVASASPFLNLHALVEELSLLRPLQSEAEEAEKEVVIEEIVVDEEEPKEDFDTEAWIDFYAQPSPNIPPSISEYLEPFPLLAPSFEEAPRLLEVQEPTEDNADIEEQITIERRDRSLEGVEDGVKGKIVEKLEWVEQEEEMYEDLQIDEKKLEIKEESRLVVAMEVEEPDEGIKLVEIASEGPVGEESVFDTASTVMQDVHLETAARREAMPTEGFLLEEVEVADVGEAPDVDGRTTDVGVLRAYPLVGPDSLDAHRAPLGSLSELVQWILPQLDGILDTMAIIEPDLTSMAIDDVQRESVCTASALDEIHPHDLSQEPSGIEEEEEVHRYPPLRSPLGCLDELSQSGLDCFLPSEPSEQPALALFQEPKRVENVLEGDHLGTSDTKVTGQILQEHKLDQDKNVPLRSPVSAASTLKSPPPLHSSPSGETTPAASTACSPQGRPVDVSEILVPSPHQKESIFACPPAKASERKPPVTLDYDLELFLKSTKRLPCPSPSPYTPPNLNSSAHFSQDFPPRGNDRAKSIFFTMDDESSIKWAPLPFFNPFASMDLGTSEHSPSPSSCNSPSPSKNPFSQ